MSQQPMNMAVMGGPVGGGGMGGPQNVGTPSGSSTITHETVMKKLNTAIYDYLLREKLYDVARLFHQQMGSQMEVKPTKNSPQGGGMMNGADGDDVDMKDPGLLNKPAELPLPVNLGTDGPFLQDWWCQFWELFYNRSKSRTPTGATQVYLNQQRMAQHGRFNMMNMNAGNRPAYNMMAMNGGGMPGDLKRAAMQNTRNMTPQHMSQLQNAKAMQQNGQAMQGNNQMERQGSQMDNMGGPRSGSPGSGDAPSPKRQRVDGGMQPMPQGRPGHPGGMQQGNQGMPPNMGPGGQGSPMNQQGIDPGDFYAANMNGRMQMQGPNAVAAANVASGNAPPNGNHALQDYQMQLMLLEQQNKKRLLMARQEQDTMSSAANGNFPGGMSPGSQRGGDPSPNPNDMQRGSPMPGQMMDPNNLPPQMRGQMMMANGGVQRAPSSHPIMPPADQQAMMRQQGMAMQNGGMFPGGQPGQMMPGQQPGGQPGQGQQMGTPRQPNNNMPPPPAPQANAGGTQPSSPSQQPAPPTPSTANKPKPGGKKEAAKKGGAAQKKGGASATPASESEHPPTPTPQTPITPMNSKSFNQQGQNQNQSLPNGQSAPGSGAQGNSQQSGQQPNAGGAQQQPDPSGLEPFGSMGENDQFNGMDLGFNISDSGDVLDNFDFDSFLNQDGGDGLGFDANFAFDGIGTGIDGAN